MSSLLRRDEATWSRAFFLLYFRIEFAAFPGPLLERTLGVRVLVDEDLLEELLVLAGQVLVEAASSPDDPVAGPPEVGPVAGHLRRVLSLRQKARRNAAAAAETEKIKRPRKT